MKIEKRWSIISVEASGFGIFGTIFKLDELLQLFRGALLKQFGENLTESYFETFQSNPIKGA